MTHPRAVLWIAPLTLCAPPASAQTRTRWEMNLGEGLVRFPSRQPDHGAPSEYEFSRIPAFDAPGWGPAPDPNSIQFDVRSSLCGASVECLDGAEFTYFRSTICIPDPRDLRAVTVRIGDVDDGARVTVFNSMFPTGFTPSNGYAFLGGGSIVSGDFASRLRVGEPNTLVITHLDDCCVESRLRDVSILANGRALPATVPTEACNGLDDNCNGSVDERLGETSCGVGPCRVTVPNCANGEATVCVPRPPRGEVCNGLDDDCDGVVDNASADCDAGSPPDVLTDAGEAPDGCRDYRCDPGLRLRGRAGPLGDCQCATGSTPRSFRAIVGLWGAVLLWAAAQSRREPKIRRSDRKRFTKSR